MPILSNGKVHNNDLFVVVGNLFSLLMMIKAKEEEEEQQQQQENVEHIVMKTFLLRPLETIPFYYSTERETHIQELTMQ